jgi:hypothetical protein
MIRLCRSLALVVVACAMLGCPMSGNGMRNIRPLPNSTKGATAAQTAQRSGEDPQTAYRRELLNNQLRHAQLDLQAATNETERQSIQERIDMIQQVMATLDTHR